MFSKICAFSESPKQDCDLYDGRARSSCDSTVCWRILDRLEHSKYERSCKYFGTAFYNLVKDVRRHVARERIDCRIGTDFECCRVVPQNVDSY